MGKKLRDEDLVLNVVINGDKAKKELGDLEESTRELKNTNKDLRAEKEKLKRAGKEESKRYKEVTAELKANNATLKKNEARMQELRAEMGVTGMTMVQLRKEAKRLQLALDNSTEGTANFKKYKAELESVTAQMTKLKAKSKGLKATFGKIADGFNRYTTMFAAIAATLTGIIFSIKEWVNGMVTLSDELSNIRKTTGLTKKEVRELNKEFKNLNTRTTRQELRGLAEEAGRLGKKSKQDVMDFIEVANQITVALGDDLGDAQEAVREVGKLTNIYKVGAQYGTGFKDSMMKVGSAINEVSANSNAQAPYLIGYLKRLGGVAGQAKVTTAEILGYGSALDQLGQKQEMAATAHGKVMIDMFTDHAKYAEIAKMSSNDFFTLLKTDANEAFLKVLEGLNGNNEGLTVLATKLDGLGIDGARAVQVLSVLASNTELVRKEQDLANKAMEEGVSLTNEYTLKNNNFAGSYAKISQYIHSKLINSSFLGWIEKVVGKMAEWVKVSEDGTVKLEEKIKSLSRYKAIIVPVIAAIIAYKSAVKIAANWTKIHYAYLVVAESITKAYAVATGVATGKVKLATVAQRLWNLAQKMNPIGLLVGILAAVGTALYMYSKRVSEASAKQIELNKLTLNAKKGIVEQKVEMEQLLRVAKNEKKSKEDRIAAIKKLNEISPEYLGNLSLEKINTDEAKKSTDLYIASLEKEARVKAAKERLVEIEKELLELKIDGAGAETSFWQNSIDYAKSYGNAINFANVSGKRTMENYHNKEAELLGRKKVLLGEIDKETKTEDGSSPKIGTRKTVGNQVFEWDGSKWNLIETVGGSPKAQAEFLKLQQQLKLELSKAGYENLKDGIEKEKALENQRWNEEKVKLEAKLITKKNLSAAEIAYNDDVNLLKEEKLQAHLTKLADLEEADNQRKIAEQALKDAGEAELKLLKAETDEEEFQAKLELAQARYDQEMALADDDRLKKLKAEQKFEKEVAKIDQDKKKRELDLFIANKNITLAKLDLASNALGVMRTLAGEESALGKALFIAQQAAAVGIILVNTAIANSEAVAASPLTFGQPWVTINTIAGGVGIASVLAQTVTGLEEGGFTDVVRAQDGKRFRAQERSKRGFVDKPSVLVGEKPEFVATNDAINNPSVRPFLDIIDYHQQIGDIHSLDLSRIFATMPSMRGYEIGGYTQTTFNPEANTPEPQQTPKPSKHEIEYQKSIIHIAKYGVSSNILLDEFEKKKNQRDRRQSEMTVTKS